MADHTIVVMVVKIIHRSCVVLGGVLEELLVLAVVTRVGVVVHGVVGVDRGGPVDHLVGG